MHILFLQGTSFPLSLLSLLLSLFPIFLFSSPFHFPLLLFLFLSFPPPPSSPPLPYLNNTRLQRPLTLSEKILYSHLDDPKNQVGTEPLPKLHVPV